MRRSEPPELDLAVKARPSPEGDHDRLRLRLSLATLSSLIASLVAAPARAGTWAARREALVARAQAAMRWGACGLPAPIGGDEAAPRFDLPAIEALACELRDLLAAFETAPASCVLAFEVPGRRRDQPLLRATAPERPGLAPAVQASSPRSLFPRS